MNDGSVSTNVAGNHRMNSARLTLATEPGHSRASSATAASVPVISRASAQVEPMTSAARTRDAPEYERINAVVSPPARNASPRPSMVMKNTQAPISGTDSARNSSETDTTASPEATRLPASDNTWLDRKYGMSLLIRGIFIGFWGYSIARHAEHRSM